MGTIIQETKINDYLINCLVFYGDKTHYLELDAEQLSYTWPTHLSLNRVIWKLETLHTPASSHFLICIKIKSQDMPHQHAFLLSPLPEPNNDVASWVKMSWKFWKPPKSLSKSLDSFRSGYLCFSLGFGDRLDQYILWLTNLSRRRHKDPRTRT